LQAEAQLVLQPLQRGRASMAEPLRDTCFIV